LLSRYISILVVLVASIVLLGWLLDIPLLKSALPDLSPMKVNTALALVASGLSLYLYLEYPADTRARLISRVCAGITLLIGLLTLIEYAFGWNLGIDQFLFTTTRTSAFPGRPAQVTALNMLLSGSALFLLHMPSLSLPRRLMAAIVAGISLFAIIGYLYGISSLYRVSVFGSIALHTALMFILLAVGILFAQPDEGFSRILTDESSAGILARRLFPACIVIPIVTGWIILKGVNAGYYDVTVSLALFAILTFISFSILTWWSAAKVTQTDEERRRSQAQFRALFDESLDVILVVDSQHSTIITINPVVQTILGYEPRNLVGRHFSVLFPAQPETGQRDLVTKLRTYGHVFISQEFLRADGSICPMDLTAAIIPWDHDRAILVTLRDISERKILEEEIFASERLRVDVEKERELMSLKEKFIATVSHDFRTPMAVIMTSNDLLDTYGERMTPERRTEQRQKIREQIWYMTDLLDDVLVLGQARSKKLSFNPAPLNLKNLCQGILDEISASDERKHAFRFSAADPLDEVTLDEKLVHRILSNLLGNAAKYSPGGGEVRLDVSRQDGEIVFCVADQGIGIPAKDRPRLFEPFHRGSNTGAIRGTGLGLAIVYESLQLHGGSISVDSQEGHGTTFTIRLPLWTAPPSQK
jgi:PAS domain S-box-containing protein